MLSMLHTYDATMLHVQSKCMIVSLISFSVGTLILEFDQHDLLLSKDSSPSEGALAIPRSNLSDQIHSSRC